MKNEIINNESNNPIFYSDILDRAEAAKVLHISCTQIERLRRAGKLPYIRLAAKCIRYRKSDCEKLLQACTIQTACNG